MRRLLTLIRALLVLPLLAAPLPALADPYVDNATIDELFTQLRQADSDSAANKISTKIWAAWFTPNDGKLAHHMSVANNLMREANYAASREELDLVVSNFPDYAEGWNQRATLFFMMGDLDASLADITKVLEIEPRHFGALAGRVLIYLKQDKHAAALRDMIAALAIHPYLSERRLFPELAQDVTHV